MVEEREGSWGVKRRLCGFPLRPRLPAACSDDATRDGYRPNHDRDAAVGVTSFSFGGWGRSAGRLPTNWASYIVVPVGSLGIISAALAGDTEIKKE